ncbi:MAG: histidine phosphatase family protein [Pirellulales bacterium]|nr:histidine phosphatase family protein [Pirellulales bacterium]
MFIYVARHAWAGTRGDPQWADDSLRELTPEGIARYTQMVKLLAARGFAPSRIGSSPYVRCRQTAEIIAGHVPTKPHVDELTALEPGSVLEPLLDWSRQHAGINHDLCWVGHSPDVEWLAAALIGDQTARLRFAKGAIAAIHFESNIQLGSGELAWLVTAKMLGL